jgi:hypothetical protein
MEARIVSVGGCAESGRLTPECMQSVIPQAFRQDNPWDSGKQVDLDIHPHRWRYGA